MSEVTPEEWEARRNQAWRVPKRYGYPEATVGSGLLGAPFLAGFTLTAAIVILSVDTKAMPWRDWSVLLFFMSAVLFVSAVHATSWARLYQTTPQQILDWWPEGLDCKYWPFVVAEQREHNDGFKMWANRARWVYNLGVLSLLLALTFAVIPAEHNFGVARMAAIGTGVFACLSEILWQAVAWRCAWRENKRDQDRTANRILDPRSWAESLLRPNPSLPVEGAELLCHSHAYRPSPDGADGARSRTTPDAEPTIPTAPTVDA